MDTEFEKNIRELIEKIRKRYFFLEDLLKKAKPETDENSIYLAEAIEKEMDRLSSAISVLSESYIFYD